MCVKVVVDMKYCPGCEANKPLSDFNKDRSRKDGLHGHCKECCRIYWQSELTGHKGNGTKRFIYDRAIDICSDMNRKYRNELKHWEVGRII